MTTELLDALVARWDALMEERHQTLVEKCAGLDKREVWPIIEAYNTDPYYEKQFDEIELKIRNLDPAHHLLPENNV